MLGEHRVGLHGGGRVGVVVAQLDGHECIAELLAQEVEPLVGYEAVACEPEPEHFEALGGAAVLHLLEVVG